MNRIEKAAIGAIMAAFLAPVAVPHALFFKVHDLSYDSVHGRVIQDRWVAWPMDGDWVAQVRTLEGGSWTAVCEGSGDDFPYRAGRVAAAMSLDLWVGDPGCAGRIEPGGPYKMTAAWTFDLFIWSWTARAESEPFTYRPEG